MRDCSLSGLFGGTSGKEPACHCRRLKRRGLRRSSGEGDSNPLQYSGLKNSWTEEPGGLQPMGSQGGRHN